ncbi:MAG: ATP-dependent zinc metalloprotease FtsH [Planctomycetota bacterium]|nr:ATP-dependent metallopeptidase FtsH/Yme1/Tma family protein [Planctomycetaceae bacterium]MDQ3330174.1 ATP-dependent zinc metalloprotease FtsH [Planctomycetota bacterium]
MSSPPPPAPPAKKRPPRNAGRRRPDKNEDEQKPPSTSGWLLGLLIAVTAIVILWSQSQSGSGERVEYSFFLDQVEADNVATVEFANEVVSGTWKSPPTKLEDGKTKKLGKEFNTVVPPYAFYDGQLSQMLRDKGIEVSGEAMSVGIGTQIMLFVAAPLLFLGVLWFLMRRTADPMGGGGMLGSFVRSPAKRFKASEQGTTFEDVAGMDQAKQELQEIVEFLKSPEKFQKLGAQIPKGVLLMGSPGTGKTLLARATAGEADVPFFSINGSEFIQMFVGVGASRVRDMFKTAKEASPCIIFIDEIDAVGRERGAGLGGGHDEREQTLNQILSEMDGFAPNEAVIVMAATNRPDVLDPALLRPGRFDRHIQVDRPTKKGRVGILKVHCRKVPLADDVDLQELAARTIGFSGAELRNLVNEAALIATRREKTVVSMDDFEAARDRVLMGPAREELLNEHEKRMTAYHEAGHTLLAWALPSLDPVYKVTIIPRGRALGLTQLLPDEERYNVGERKLHDQLTMVMGGRAAEKLVFDEHSAGAEDDLRRATQLARRMVAYWGMSDEIGPVAFRQGEEHPFLGKEMHTMRDFSEQTAFRIDQEIQRFLNEAADRATTLLRERREELDRIVDALLEQESIGKEEIIAIMGERVASEAMGGAAVAAPSRAEDA